MKLFTSSKELKVALIACLFFSIAYSDTAKANDSEVPSYQIEKGDNLWNISKKFLFQGFSFPHVAKKNSEVIGDPNLIHPGDVIDIPKCERLFECLDWKHFVDLEDEKRKARSTFGALILGNSWKARWHALEVTSKALEQGNATGGWDIAVGVNREAIATLLSTAIGSKLVNTSSGFLNGTEVSIVNVEVKPSLASLDTRIQLTATTGPVNLELSLEGAVLVSRVEYDSDEKGREVARFFFRIEPWTVQPVAKLGRLSVQADKFWSKLAPDLALLLRPEIFETKIELPAEFSVKTGIDKVASKTAGEDANLKFRMTVPKVDLRTMVAYSAPVYSGNAIWLMGKLREEEVPEIRPDLAPAISPNDLRLAVQDQYDELQKKLPADLVAFGVDDAQPRLAVRLQNRLIGAATAKLAALTPEQRRISIKLVSSSGDLSRTDWDAGVLGRGGFKSYIACDTCANAAIQLGEPTFESADGRIAFTVPVSASGHLDLGAHFDPVIGGGAGTSVRVNVNTNGTQTVDISATPRIVKDADGHSIAVSDWSTTCHKLDLKAVSDGKLKFDVGWLKVPSVGVRIKAPVGSDVLEPILLFDRKPTLTLFPRPESIGKSKRSRDWLIITSNVAASTSFEPLALSVKSDAIFASVDLQVSAIPRPQEDLSKDTAEELAQKAVEENEQARARIEAVTKTAIASQAKQSPCNPDLEIAVLVDKFEIGPNNELVKLARKLGHEVSIDKVEGWFKNPGDSFNRSDVGKAVNCIASFGKSC